MTNALADALAKIPDRDAVIAVSLNEAIAAAKDAKTGKRQTAATSAAVEFLACNTGCTEDEVHGAALAVASAAMAALNYSRAQGVADAARSAAVDAESKISGICLEVS